MDPVRPRPRAQAKAAMTRLATTSPVTDSLATKCLATASLATAALAMALLVAVNLATGSPAAAQEEPDTTTYRVGIDPHMPPYTLLDARGEATGFAVDLLRAVAQVQGFRLTFHPAPWYQLRRELEQGTLDIIANMAASEDGLVGIELTLPHSAAYDALFVRDDNRTIRSEADLAGRRVLVMRDDLAHEYMLRSGLAEELLVAPTMPDVLRRLAAGEADGALVPLRVGDRLQQHLQLTHLRRLGTPIDGYARTFSFAVPQGRGALLDLLEQGLTIVTNNQRYLALYDQWFAMPVDRRPAVTPALMRFALGFLLPVLVLLVGSTAWTWSLRRTVRRRTEELEREVAERQGTEQALRASESRLQALLDNTTAIVAMKDPDGRYLLANPRFADLVARDQAAIVGCLDSELFPAEVAQLLRDRDRRVLHTGGAFECEESLPGDGETLTFLTVRFPLRHADGELVAVCTMGTDITARKRAEEDRQLLEGQILQSQKLESLGMLAGGIAHDFNNLLTGILGHVGMAQIEVGDGGRLATHLHDIEQATRQAAELCQQMQAYAGQGTFVVRTIDLSRLVSTMGRMIEASMPAEATLDLCLAESLPTLEGDATQLRQVVMNLITNALEALDDPGGTVRVATGLMVCNAAYLERTHVPENLLPGTYVYLEVADDGCGMDEATRQRIFDPFFTTKRRGRGLGLATTLGIIRAHRGALRVTSMPQEGTRVRLLFPASPRPLQATGDTAQVGNLVGDSTVLVIDDEEVVRNITSRVLGHAGYRVLVAADGPSGLEHFGHHQDEISLVLLDMNMPGMNGRETFDRLRALRHDVRVLLTSGYDAAQTVDAFQEGELVGFLQKPYRPVTLLRKVMSLTEVVRQPLRPVAVEQESSV